MQEKLAHSKHDHVAPFKQEAKMDWEVIKTKIRHKWKKLDEKDLESIKDNLSLLSDKLQSVYSYPKTKADKEFMEFKESLEHKPSHH